MVAAIAHLFLYIKGHSGKDKKLDVVICGAHFGGGEGEGGVLDRRVRCRLVTDGSH